MNQKKLEKKVAIITGGAGGAGAEICTLFSREGASVIIADMNIEVGKKLEAKINAIGGKAHFIKTDVTSTESVKNCVDKCVELYGKLDILVNIACIMSVESGYIHEITEEMFDKDIAINLKGAFLFTKYALPEMMKTGEGAIVSFSSVSASRGALGHTIYGAAKAGVEAMTRKAAAQYGRLGIRANCIRPGIMMNPVSMENPKGKEYADYMFEHIPYTRIGMGSDAAPLALFLASDDSAYINGQVITLDGGLTCHEPQWKEDMLLQNDSSRMH